MITNRTEGWRQNTPGFDLEEHDRVTDLIRYLGNTGKYGRTLTQAQCRELSIALTNQRVRLANAQYDLVMVKAELQKTKKELHELMETY